MPAVGRVREHADRADRLLEADRMAVERACETTQEGLAGPSTGYVAASGECVILLA